MTRWWSDGEGDIQIETYECEPGADDNLFPSLIRQNQWVGHISNHSAFPISFSFPIEDMCQSPTFAWSKWRKKYDFFKNVMQSLKCCTWQKTIIATGFWDFVHRFYPLRYIWHILKCTTKLHVFIFVYSKNFQEWNCRWSRTDMYIFMVQGIRRLPTLFLEQTHQVTTMNQKEDPEFHPWIHTKDFKLHWSGERRPIKDRHRCWRCSISGDQERQEVQQKDGVQLLHA